MIVPAVSRSAQRGTSGMIEGLASCFTRLEDPRETRRCDHQLVDILAIAVCAVVACAESWEDIELYGRSKRAWLETFLGRHRQLVGRRSRRVRCCPPYAAALTPVISAQIAKACARTAR